MFIGLGAPASLGDIAVPRDLQGRVDFYTPDGQYKFGTSPFDCATGDTIGDGQFTSDNGAQAIMGCAHSLLWQGLFLAKTHSHRGHQVLGSLVYGPTLTTFPTRQSVRGCADVQLVVSMLSETSSESAARMFP